MSHSPPPALHAAGRHFACGKVNGMKKILLKILIWLGSLLLIGGPVAIVLLGNIDGIMAQRYFAIDWGVFPIYALFTVLFLLPAIILSVWLLLEHRRGGLRGGTRVLLTIGYILSLGVSLLGLLVMAFVSPYCSQTADIAHYMQLDDYINAYPGYISAFFPDTPGEDAVYRYRADYATLSHEVTASWVLLPEELDAELTRVQAVWKEEGRMYAEETRGRFTCLIAYEDARDMEYSISIFAYDPASGECRWYDRDGGNDMLMPQDW